MFVANDCTMDSRVLREAASLADAGATVTIIATASARAPGDEQRGAVRIVRVPDRPPFPRPVSGAAPARRLPDLPGLFGYGLWRATMFGLRLISFWLATGLRIALWGLAAQRSVPDADVYHGHDLTGLLPAWWSKRRRGGRLVYDSHELYVESSRAATSARLSRRAIAAVEAFLLRRTAAVVTVNPAIAAELERRYPIAPATVVMNCPPRWRADDPEPPTFDHFRVRAGLPIPAGTPILVYQGGFRPHRGIEPLIQALLEPQLRTAVAVFLGYGPLRERIEQIALTPELAGRVFVVDAVPPDELLEWTASADVTVAPIERSTLNHWLATPNKLFESIAAGVPVVASDFPEMARIIRDAGAGALCDPSDPASIARAAAGILDLPAPDRAELRRRCRRAALERYNWETEVGGLLDLYARLAGRPGTGGVAAASGPAA